MKNSGKHAVVLLTLTLIVLVSCNFPIRDFTSIVRPFKTLDPAIFDTRPSTAPLTPEPGEVVTSTPAPPPLVDETLYHIYPARSGDTLNVVASHFGVSPAAITSVEPIPPEGILPPGQYLVIPKNADNQEQREVILPDSAVINSPCATNFDVNAFVNEAGGYLSNFSQLVGGVRINGAEVVQNVAKNMSVNPLLLLAFVEYRSGLVYGGHEPSDIYHPLDLDNEYFKGLSQELSLAARMINTGYYGWRYGEMTMVTFSDQLSQRIAPNLNAGSAGMMYLFSQLYTSTEWENNLFGAGGFMEIYLALFPDPGICAAGVEPMLTNEVTAPQLVLPFAEGEVWALTAGPHYSWVEGTPLGALDFAPHIKDAGCTISPLWARASAPGVVTRSDNSVVMLTLEDESGLPSGWEIMYMHIAARDSVTVGTRVEINDPIGHPSCEGGTSSGTHLHITRKYKGEWIGTKELFSFVMSDWTAVPGDRVYLGKLVKDDRVVIARQGGKEESLISR